MGPPPNNSQPHRTMGSEEAVLLGRRGIVGAVNATSLATLVRSLRVGSPTNIRRGLQSYFLKCNEQGLEIRGPKYDEGFESDDTESTRSGGETEERTGDTSSGVSDLDDTSEQNSLIRIPPLRELYSIRDVVFCHGDPIFPKIVVWVVNTSKRPSPGFLEALVFECRNESSVKDLCMNYQEISRRYKLEQYNKRKDTNTSSLMRNSQKYQNNDYEQKSNFTREMECVTGIESLRQNDCNIQVMGRRRERTLRQREPPSLLILPAKNESELHKIWTPPPTQHHMIEEEPPKRPERRRYIRKKSQQPQQMHSQDDNILRGQFIRVNVDPKTPILLKPQFTWMYGVPTSSEMIPTQTMRSRRSCRSVSPTMSRRRAPPMPHRYGIDTHLTANRNMNGLTQKFTNLTTAIGGTLKYPKKYNNFEQQQYTTLKPVIKKSNKRFNNEYEPKKVTFSAYATVQVVD
jgi:hypothetical protein